MHQAGRTRFASPVAKAAAWAVAILFLCSPAAWAKGKPSGGGSGGGGGSTSDIPVTFNVSDSGASGAYFVQSDTGGPYANGQDNVTAVLQAGGLNGISNGDGLLALGSSNRSLGVTLSSANAVQGTDPGVSPFGTLGFGYDHSIVQISCTRVSLSMLAMTGSSTNPGVIQCPMSIRLSTDATKSSYYLLNIGPADSETSQAVQIQCNNADSVGCNDWEVYPVPKIVNNVLTEESEARLTLRCGTGHCSAVDEGDFYLTFHFHITRP